MGSPSIFVYDCNNAGLIVQSFIQFAAQREQEQEVRALESWTIFSFYLTFLFHVQSSCEALLSSSWPSTVPYPVCTHGITTLVHVIKLMTISNLLWHKHTKIILWSWCLHQGLVSIILYNNYLMRHRLSSEELWRSRRVLLAEVDNTLWDLHNYSSDDKKAKFNNCFIIHSK